MQATSGKIVEVSELAALNLTEVERAAVDAKALLGA